MRRRAHLPTPPRDRRSTPQWRRRDRGNGGWNGAGWDRAGDPGIPRLQLAPWPLADGDAFGLLQPRTPHFCSSGSIASVAPCSRCGSTESRARSRRSCVAASPPRSCIEASAAAGSCLLVRRRGICGSPPATRLLPHRARHRAAETAVAKSRVQLHNRVRGLAFRSSLGPRPAVSVPGQACNRQDHRVGYVLDQMAAPAQVPPYGTNTSLSTRASPNRARWRAPAAPRRSGPDRASLLRLRKTSLPLQDAWCLLREERERIQPCQRRRDHRACSVQTGLAAS